MKGEIKSTRKTSMSSVFLSERGPMSGNGTCNYGVFFAMSFIQLLRCTKILGTGRKREENHSD